MPRVPDPHFHQGLDVSTARSNGELSDSSLHLRATPTLLLLPVGFPALMKAMAPSCTNLRPPSHPPRPPESRHQVTSTRPTEGRDPDCPRLPFLSPGPFGTVAFPPLPSYSVSTQPSNLHPVARMSSQRHGSAVASRLSTFSHLPGPQSLNSFVWHRSL